MIPVIEAFVRTVAFMDRLRNEGRIRDYALVGGLALSAWVDPRNAREKALSAREAGIGSQEDGLRIR